MNAHGRIRRRRRAAVAPATSSLGPGINSPDRTASTCRWSGREHYQTGVRPAGPTEAPFSVRLGVSFADSPQSVADYPVRNLLPVSDALFDCVSEMETNQDA